MLNKTLEKILTAALCFLMAVPGFAATQDTQVRIGGTVVDQAGVALPGAYVSVAGTKKGVSTGIDGTFSLDVPANAVLLITYVGFKTVEMGVVVNDKKAAVTFTGETIDDEKLTAILLPFVEK